jgi:ribulose-phosphate 3-epimerase
VAGSNTDNPTGALLSASILGGDLLELGKAIQVADEGGADLLQLDVADGHFTPTISFGEEVAKRARAVTALPIEVHLMVSRPQDWIGVMADLDVDFVLFHVEAAQRLQATMRIASDRGLGVGLAMNTETPPERLEYVLPYVDVVTLMAILPGFSGQQFIPETLRKIEKLRQTIDDRAVATLIEVDGGVKEDNVATIVAAGADLVVASSAIYHQPDPRRAVKALQARMREPHLSPERTERIATYLRGIETRRAARGSSLAAIPRS